MDWEAAGRTSLPGKELCSLSSTGCQKVKSKDTIENTGHLQDSARKLLDLKRERLTTS